MKWSDMAWPIPQEIIKPKNVVVFDVQRKEADRGGWKPSHRCQGKNRIRFIWQQWWPCQSENLKKKKKSSEGLCFISVKKKHTPRFLAGTSQRWATGRCLRGNPPALISSPGPSRLESRRDFLTGEQELSYVNSVKVSVFLDALFLGSRGSLCSL